MIFFFSYTTSRCASCIGESARAQWFRHSDGWRSGSSTLGSGTNLISQGTGHRRSPWDSLPSLKQDGSLNDSGYKSTRTDSFEQRLDDTQNLLKETPFVNPFECLLNLSNTRLNPHFVFESLQNPKIFVYFYSTEACSIAKIAYVLTI